jgi:WhiB family redox-sensing transcriptional regulator
LIDNWREHAECLGMGTDLFFPPERGRRPQRKEEIETEKKRITQAKSICGRCIVRDACLSYAIDNDLVGIYGGYTEKERRAIAQQKDYKLACDDRDIA